MTNNASEPGLEFNGEHYPKIKKDHHLTAQKDPLQLREFLLLNLESLIETLPNIQAFKAKLWS